MTVAATNRGTTLGVEKTPGGTVSEADIRRVLLNLLSGGGSAADADSLAADPKEAASDVGETLQKLEREIHALHGVVSQLAETLGKPEAPEKASYTTAEVAEILGLRPLT